MELQTTPLPGLVLLRPRIFHDDRGYFLETFNERRFRELTGSTLPFVQDNESRSSAGVLRGLHFQADPHAQGKLVHVVAGAVIDVCVDIRPGAATFGRHFAVRLDGRTKELLWIPPGFAHGFLALEDDTVFAYKCTDYYTPAAERTIRWDDADLAIPWGADPAQVSEKDRQGLSFAAYRATVPIGQ